MDTTFQKAIDIPVKRSTNKKYNIRQVARVLNIKIVNSPSTNQLCTDIYEKLRKNSLNKPSLQYFLSKFYNGETKKINFCQLLIDSLYELFYPSDMEKDSPILITENKYKELIEKKKNDDLTEQDSSTLDEAMHIKLCHCIKKIYIKNIIDTEFFEKIRTLNPYAICTSSIYKKRGFNVPPCAARNCGKSYNWYRDNKY